MYLALVTFTYTGLYAAAYVALTYLNAAFFGSPAPRFSRASLRTLALFAALVFALFALVDLIPDLELGNRLQHAAGGMLGVLLCYRAVADQRVRLGRFRFIVWAALIVTALGVCNELFEFFIQAETGYILADNPLDTWRDLASNTVGIALAAPLASLFVKKV